MATTGGCASHGVPPLSVAERDAGATGYRIGAGDRLRITVYNETALTGEYNVTPAGAVAFPLVGDVPAATRTIDDLTRDITRRLTGTYVADPRVSVEVVTFRPFYILGEVNHPGEYPFSTGLTLEQAIAKAGGFTYRANAKVAYLRRETGPGERAVALGGDGRVVILPGDTIRVGERYF